MKSIAVLLLAFAPSVHAASTVNLKPGSSVIVNSYEVTTVTCEGAPVQSHFCSCGGTVAGIKYDSGMLIRTDFFGTQKDSTIVANYGAGSSCIEALTKKLQPACQ